MPGRRNTPAEPVVTQDKLVRLAKTGIGHSEAAAELGVAVSQISSLAWSNRRGAAGRFGAIAATAAAVKKARDVEENRWELIAARAGESVARVKELYGGDEAAAQSSVGRGRKAGNGNTGGKSATASSKKGKAAAAASPRRARTRAERAAARGNNPS